MDRASILNMITTYIKNIKPDVAQEDIPSIPVSKVLTSSFDVIEFLMHLEDELKLEEELDLEALGPKFAQNMTFSELTNEVVAYLEANG